MLTPAFFSSSWPKRAIVFEAIGILGAADNRLTGGAQSFGFGTLAERVVEDDDVGPFGVALPILGFRNEAVGDVALFFSFDVVTDVVTFLECDLPEAAMSPMRPERETKRNLRLSIYVGGRAAAAPRKRETTYSSQGGTGHCDISLKINEGREGVEATLGVETVHHRGWVKVSVTCPEGQSSCSTWPLVQGMGLGLPPLEGREHSQKPVGFSLRGLGRRTRDSREW